MEAHSTPASESHDFKPEKANQALFPLYIALLVFL